MHVVHFGFPHCYFDWFIILIIKSYFHFHSLNHIRDDSPREIANLTVYFVLEISLGIIFHILVI